MQTLALVKRNHSASADEDEEDTNSAWARTTKRGVSLPVSGQRLIMFFGKLIMSRTQNDVIAVWIL